MGMASKVYLLTILLLVLNNVTPSDVMSYASKQYSIVYEQYINLSCQYYPYYGYPMQEMWNGTTATTGWTSGYFPGMLWNIFEHTGSLKICQMAMNATELTAPFANNTSTHDVGNVIMPGFGNGYRLLKLVEYLTIIKTAAHSLSTRYSSIVRSVRSWNTGQEFLVAIDNMVAIELLFEAANQTNNQTWHDMAWQHANRTMYEHFRPDNSTYHVVDYNETDGNVIRKYTNQGYADWSTWSRGQAWAIHGLTIAYRYTRYQPFLDKAIGATNYFLSHLPSSTDLIPYWDFDAPKNSTISYQPRDTSAAAIVASGLVELSQYVSTPEIKNHLLSSAKSIIDQLTSSRIFIPDNPNYKLPALMANGSIGPYPARAFDVALSFGDYYLTQAIVRLSKL